MSPTASKRRQAAPIPAHGPAGNLPIRTDIPAFEVFADSVFQRYQQIWKPHTLTVNRSYLRNQLLPWFGGRTIDDITPRDVRLWFAELLETPAAANRSLPILSVILRHAETQGFRPPGSNPCAGIRRYRQCGRERFLSDDEIRRLGAAFTEHESAGSQAAAAIRLLMLTGCRQSEIRTLRWSDYREGHLFLADSKTGPRTVWLSSAARSVLDRLHRGGPWVFPSSSGATPLSSDALYVCWRTLRMSAEIGNVRLHDLRHSYASYALRLGETVPTIGRLLGHRDPATTLRYTHFADSAARHASEAIGEALGAGL